LHQAQTFALAADMTRQYKTMTSQMLEKITKLKTEINEYKIKLG
jgi:hypothetical protein